MEGEKPQTLDEYKSWLAKAHGLELQKLERDYDTATIKIHRDAQASPFWQQLLKNLTEFDGEYRLQTRYRLLLSSDCELLVKPWDSFLLKSFRRNVLENTNWPEPPSGEWVLPPNWFEAIPDIVRTQLVVKYLDGVEFLVQRISRLCSPLQLACHCDMEARATGYYAAHVYVWDTFEIPRMTWDTQRVRVSMEIQVTTQLQEVIRRLLHVYYERRRRTTDREATPWQWQYKSDEFAANYLGHILHYMEGMIMDVRERQAREATR